MRCSVIYVMVVGLIFWASVGHGLMVEASSGNPGERLTPATPLAPVVHGPAIVGVRAYSEFFYRVPISGERPISVTATGLPKGVSISADGMITGKISYGYGRYKVNLTVQNLRGQVEHTMILRTGQGLALTPLMGWTTWGTHRDSATQDKVQQALHQLESTGLANFGWNHVFIDDGWQGERHADTKALQANEKYPDMKALCDLSHQAGIRVGLYSTPWMGTPCGYVGGSAPNEECDYSPLVRDGADAHQIGPVLLVDKDAKQWAEWGVDFVKWDWSPTDLPTAVLLGKALNKSGRDIVFHIADSANVRDEKELMGLLKASVHVARVMGDAVLGDTWQELMPLGFAHGEVQFAQKPGFWIDMDMLRVGTILRPNPAAIKGRDDISPYSLQPCPLNPHEQYSHFTLWALMSTPLMLGCDLAKLDDFLLGLLTNGEVLAVNQDSTTAMAHELREQDGVSIWAKEMANGSIVIAFFNTTEAQKTLEFAPEHLPIVFRMVVRDLWRQKNLGTMSDDGLRVTVAPRGVVLLRFSSAHVETPTPTKKRKH